jgi:hypothetical protein
MDPNTLKFAIRIGALVLEAERVASDADFPYNLGSDFVEVFKFYGNDLATDVNTSNGTFDPACYLPFGVLAKSVDGDNYVAAIRGTETIIEWIQDARFEKEPFSKVAGAGNTEDGFTDVYTSLSTTPQSGGTRLVDAIAEEMKAHPEAALTITGHSLGSALATLLALDVAANTPLSPSVFTFASPYVGDKEFVGKYNSTLKLSWRIANDHDLVTQLPPNILNGFEHVAEEYRIDFTKTTTLGLPDVVYNHSLANYLHFLSQILETSQS